MKRSAVVFSKRFNNYRRADQARILKRKRKMSCVTKFALIMFAVGLCIIIVEVSILRFMSNSPEDKQETMRQKRHVTYSPGIRKLGEFSTFPYMDKLEQQLCAGLDAPQLVCRLSSELEKLDDEVAIHLKGKPTAVEFHSRISLLTNLAWAVTNVTSRQQRQTAEELSTAIQQRIHTLQNPPQCEAAKQLLCILNNWYGFGGMCHHLSLCYHVALATRRVLVVHYLLGDLYSAVLKPSSPCQKSQYKINEIPSWNGKSETIHSNAKIIVYRVQHILRTESPFPTDALPQDVATEIQHFHGVPVAWWQGQIIKYILRPVDGLEENINKLEKKIGFGWPIVGIHVRRTDKPRIHRHDFVEYMQAVVYWYGVYEQQLKRDGKVRLHTRNVFVATEDPGVAATLRSRYPGYRFLDHNEATKLSDKKWKRSSSESLIGVTIDIHLLAKCDHLVCDANSNVCRIAYELMQTRHVDASARFTPVGLVYHNFPALNKFTPLIDYTSMSEPNKSFVAKQVKLVPMSAKLDVRFYWQRVTNVVPVCVLCDA